MLAPRSTSLLRTTAAPRCLPVSPSQRLSQVARHFSGSSSRSVQDAYILAAARTPTGKFCGGLKDVSAPKLASYVIKEAISRSSVPAEKITDVYLGNVLQASIGQAPARQAVIFAGLSVETEAVTVNKVCASGLKAVHFAAQNIQLGLAEAQVAGGMENMSQVPRYLPRNSPPYGHVNAEDGLLKDGLTDVYDKIHMGNCAENTAKNHTITRKEQDDYTIESYRRAKAAWDSGAFSEEVVPITVSSRKGDTVVSKDEEYQLDKVDKIPVLKPVFQKDGTITAASSSTLSDGASAIVLGNKEIAEKHGGGSRVLAKIVGYADAATNPIDFPLAPTLAIPKALQRAGLEVKDIAKWEINEAFAAVSKANEKVLGLDPSKVNVNGGAIALGHALGSSGSRILTTLLYLLKPGEYGVAAICNGGGGASAMVVQRIEKP